jgi:hypothetical protein
MPSIDAELTFLANIPLYDKEKPYHILLAVGDPVNNDPTIPLGNLQWEEHQINLHDMRELSDGIGMDVCGFEVLQHPTKVSLAEAFDVLDMNTMDEYKNETSEYLKDRFSAVYVTCYDFRVRESGFGDEMC